MDIKLVSEKYKTGTSESRVFLSHFEKLFLSAQLIVDVPVEAIDKVVIVDRKKYGAEIAAIQGPIKDGQTTHSDNEIFVGVGKTIFNENSVAPSSSIVLEVSIVEKISDATLNFTKLKDLSTTQQLSFYIIAHEIGHAKDNLLRKSSDKGLTVHDNMVFKIEQIAKYYLSILLSEFAACYHSGKAATQQLFDWEIEQYRKQVYDQIILVTTSWVNYQNETQRNNGSSQTKLRRLAFDAAQSFWVILLQYAKLVGTSLANKYLDATELNQISDNPNCNTILKEFQTELANYWTIYPKWDENNLSSWMKFWSKMSLNWHYRFEEGDGAGDAIYFDNAAIFQFYSIMASECNAQLGKK